MNGSWRGAIAALAVVWMWVGCSSGVTVGQAGGAGGGGGGQPVDLPTCPPLNFPSCEQGFVDEPCLDEGVVASRCAGPHGFLSHDCPECPGGTGLDAGDAGTNGAVCARWAAPGPVVCCVWGPSTPNPCLIP
jgi:hypothetical protein